MQWPLLSMFRRPYSLDCTTVMFRRVHADVAVSSTSSLHNRRGIFISARLKMLIMLKTTNVLAQLTNMAGRHDTTIDASTEFQGPGVLGSLPGGPILEVLLQREYLAFQRVA